MTDVTIAALHSIARLASRPARPWVMLSPLRTVARAGASHEPHREQHGRRRGGRRRRAVLTRHGTLLDGRAYVAAALWIVAILGNYGAGGYAWPAGPAIDMDTQALMVIVGLVAWAGAIVLTVRIAIHPRIRSSS